MPSVSVDKLAGPSKHPVHLYRALTLALGFRSMNTTFLVRNPGARLFDQESCARNSGKHEDLLVKAQPGRLMGLSQALQLLGAPVPSSNLRAVSTV